MSATRADLIGGIFGAAFFISVFLFFVWVVIHSLRTGRCPVRYGSPILRAENPRLFVLGVVGYVLVAAMWGYFIGYVALDALRNGF
jgi:hypothetical protein